MMTKFSTKRALLTSIMALFLCFTMLLGTTYAWFTDSVTSSNNKIKSGTLLLDLELYDVEAGEYVSIKSSNAPIFNHDKWEPGYTDVKLLKVENEGSLALKWKATLFAKQGLSDLATVIDVYVKPSETALAMPTDRNLLAAGYTYAGTVADFVSTLETTTVGTLEANEAAYLGIALKMQETAGNEYQDMDLGAFDIQILATQLTFEEDSLGDDYDELATYAFTEQKVLPANASALSFELRDQKNAKVGSAEVPAEAIDDIEAPVKVTVKETSLNANVTVATGMEASTFDVTVTNLKAGNTTPVKASIRIPTGLDPETVKLYHYETLIDCTYNPTTGYVSFESTSFSPFTVVYDEESEYVAPEVTDTSKLPVANVTSYDLQDTPGYSETEKWTEFDGWAPTAGLDSKLEAAYVFSCTETFEEAEQNPFAYWHCDFVVSLDRALDENQLFLGGNYGSFGWVGFHNGELKLEANTEVPLLGSVTNNPWTYLDVVNFVDTFICGVGDVNDALSGATFKVMLRLTNPANEAEFYNVATIEYTFN